MNCQPVSSYIDPEAGAGQVVEQRLVHLARLHGHHAVGFFHQGQRRGRGDQVALLKRTPLVVQGVGQLRARFEIDDQGRAALHQGDLRAVRHQVLRDVVAAGAGADDHDGAPVPMRGVAVFA